MPTLIDQSGNIDYFGKLSWANAVDWLVTLCLGGIVALMTLRLGGVRPETQVDLLPWFAPALALHGLWVAVLPREERRLSSIPFLFLPFVAWACISVLYLTPVPWRGSYELIYLTGALIFFWVAVNNLRTRAQLWVFILLSLTPAAGAIFNAYYQFFQQPDSIADAGARYAVLLDGGFLGRSTGVFADPHSFAAYALILLPCLIIAAVEPRLPIILRVLAFYLAVIVVVAVTFAQSYWAAAMVVALLAVVPFFCFQKLLHRVLVAVLGLLLAAGVFAAMYVASPVFKRGLSQALTTEGEGVRLLLWEQALDATLAAPLTGVGAGAYSLAVEQSASRSLPFVPESPHNDYLLVLSQYGLVGGLLLFLPFLFIFFQALRRWREEPFTRTVRGPNRRRMMPPQKFSLSVGLCGCLAYALAAFFSFPAYVPGLLLLGVGLFAIVVKNSFARRYHLPAARSAGLLYFLCAATAGLLFAQLGGLKLESLGLTLRADQKLAQLVEKQVPVAGNRLLLDRVIHLYEDAILADPENADAWIGLSKAIHQTHFRKPARFARTGERALQAAQEALRLCPEYWGAHAQVGIAHALLGNLAEAEAALVRAVDMAPNSSNANYFYGAFLSGSGQDRARALEYVNRALEINPQNAVARRLQRRLFIL